MQTIKTKVLDEYRYEIERIACENGKTVSDLLRMLVEGLVYEHYEVDAVDGTRIVPTEEYLIALLKSIEKKGN